MLALTTKHSRLTALRPLSPESVASLAAAWDVRMVYESNSIEGNTLTLRETELVLSKGITVSGKPLKDHMEAVNLMQAWQRVKELAQPESAFTERDLLDLHHGIARIHCARPPHGLLPRPRSRRLWRFLRVPEFPQSTTRKRTRRVASRA